MMFRRSFGTIHQGHLPEDITLDEWFYAAHGMSPRSSATDWEDMGYTAGAFALEEGTATMRRHIQFYVEHKRKRPSTLAKDFGVTTPFVFDRVRDAQGAWDYCTASGAHEGKEGVIDSFSFGTPKLHGDTTRADLKLLVGFVCDGIHPFEIMKSHPYAYCVHRQRIWHLWKDMRYQREPE